MHNFCKPKTFLSFQKKSSLPEMRLPDMCNLYLRCELPVNDPAVQDLSVRPIYLLKYICIWYKCVNWNTQVYIVCVLFLDRFFVVGSRDMTGRIFSLFPVANFSPVTLSGHRNTVRGCFFEENSLNVSLLVLNSGCKLITSMWWVYSTVRTV